MTRLHTDRLVLRPIDPASETDIDAVHSWQSLPEVARYTPYEPRSRDEVASTLRSPKRPKLEHLLVLAGGTPIGDAMLFRSGDAIEVGYELHPDWWGHGYATEICRALVGHAQSACPGESIAATIHPDNGASRAVLERCGFVEHDSGTDEHGPYVSFELTRD